jgi:undecaprenyl diphosphate synthase
MTSTFHQLPSHTALILDGNGRWAARRGLPRWAGHRAGARAVGPIVSSALELGLANLTLYAFSSDNWRRGAEEVSRLLVLLERSLARQAAEGARRGVRLSVIGRRDRLPGSLLGAIERAEERTDAGRRLHLRLAVDYSARHALRTACGSCEASEPIPDVDLLIRTGGERRLSDFMLWESAYAELLFLDVLWPDFGPQDLRGAIAEFARRERRFGALPAPSLSLPLQEVSP